ADWGDYISFAQRLRERADKDGVDLLLVDTGDRIEGNGLYDASDPKGKFTRDIFKQQEIDVICSGNHELYKQSSAENEYNYTVPNFKGNYLASNLDILDPSTGKQVPLAPRFKKFTTENQGVRILAFGFLFDFKGNWNNTVVQRVEATIKEDWFQDALRDKEVDLFLVAGHVAIRSDEYRRIFKAIREVNWDTPIQFFGGHTHIRDYKKYDAKAYALESGRYMETIGFQSISGLTTGGKKEQEAGVEAMKASPIFDRRYIDNNLFSFHSHTGLNSSTFPTPHGRNVSSMIAADRRFLKLDKQFGCAPRDLWTNRAPYPSNYSIFSWLEKSVMPTKVRDETRSGNSSIVIINTGAMRFDVFEGPFTKDSTFTVSPFTTGFHYIKDVPFNFADRLLALLNSNGQILETLSPNLNTWTLAPPEQQSIRNDILTPEDHRVNTHPQTQNQIPLSSVSSEDNKDLTPGYTTKDDSGTDGDDTIHSPISFYRVPNCIESRQINTSSSSTSPHEEPNDSPPVVDVVFLEFIQPWILLALQFLGAEYKDEDVLDYADGKDFTGMIADWVAENWSGDC
ncbi:hypothetical protein MMC09_000213, partial [Bachmanniomyces sp. S44760]|nr:hypothetical protein [Bachmanniomyces sp. S44760]